MRYTFLQPVLRLLPIAAAAIMFAVIVATPVAAVDVLQESCSKGGGSSAVCNPQGKLFGSGSIWQNIVTALIFIIGAAAVVMIIIGGLRYITANGDQSQISSAKNTIIYSVVGLVLAVAAGGIVNFVLGRL